MHLAKVKHPAARANSTANRSIMSAAVALPVPICHSLTPHHPCNPFGIREIRTLVLKNTDNKEKDPVTAATAETATASVHRAPSPRRAHHSSSALMSSSCARSLAAAPATERALVRRLTTTPDEYDLSVGNALSSRGC